MELIPATQQPERNKLTYLLDENIQVSKSEKLSKKYVNLRDILGWKCPDWIVLEKAKEMELTIITCDKGLVVRALIENQDIVYQDDYGNRFYLRGKATKLIERGSKQKRWSEVDKQKKQKIIFNYAPFL